MTSRENFHQLGSSHIHVDSAIYPQALDSLASTLKACDYPTHINTVEAFVKGPQRENPLYSSIYDEHTPGKGRKGEIFSRFSTTPYDSLRDRNTIRAAINALGVERLRGAVIEEERVIGRIGDHAEWVDISKKLPYGEIHHAIDVPEDSPLTIDEISRIISEEAKVSIGGVFVLSRPEEDVKAFRTNAFFMNDQPFEAIRTQIEQENARIRQALLARGVEFQLWTQVEEIKSAKRRRIFQRRPHEIK